MSRARQAAHGMLQNRVSERGGRRTEGTAQSTARLQRQSEGGPRARVCKDRAKEDREGPAPSTVCLQRQTQREREEQGPARSAQGDGRERAQGGRGLSLVFKSRTDVAEKASKGDRER